MSQRSRVIQLYKSLLSLGKNYVHGYDYFRQRLHESFARHKHVKDPARIEVLLAYGEYVKKELEALQMLRKYKQMKRKYYLDKMTPRGIKDVEDKPTARSVSEDESQFIPNVSPKNRKTS